MMTLPTLDLPVCLSPDAGFGALMTDRGSLPLARMAVHVRVSDLLAVTEVEQTFVNAHDIPLEATYIFPLPDRAAVGRFRLEVAGRVVEGELQERNAANRTYDRAINAGHRAAIAEEERPGVFTVRVGNLLAGEAATVKLSLTGILPYADGEATLRFPLVVAPRFFPGVAYGGPQVGTGTAPDTDRTPDASRISPPVMLPGMPNPVDLSIAVEVRESALSPRDFRSTLHTVAEERARGVRFFRVLPGERLDRDFVLRFRLGAESLRSSLLAADGTFLLTLVPPALRADAIPRPRNVVFVLDRSGSMAGWKMVAARRAVARMVETLTDRDRFAVLAFDDRIETPPGLDGTSLVRADSRGRFLATEYLAKVDTAGGTEMAGPLETAVRVLSATPAGEDRLLVLLTDGQVGNEDEILSRIGMGLKAIRVFTLGIDRAVNETFLRRLADTGGGGCEVVESEARLDEVMQSVHRRISTPVMTGLSLTSELIRVVPDSVVPSRLPDVMADVPVTVAGRYEGANAGTVSVTGTDAAGRKITIEVGARPCDEPAALKAVWAKLKIRELEDAIVSGHRGDFEREIVALSLGAGVLSRFTAFVAVDKAEVVNEGGERRKVTQPVESVCDFDAEESDRLTLAAHSNRMPPPAPCAAPPAMPARMRAMRATRSAPEPETSSFGRPGGTLVGGVLNAVAGLFGRAEAKADSAKAKKEVAPDPRRELRGRFATLPADAALVAHLRTALCDLRAYVAAGPHPAELTDACDRLQNALRLPNPDPAALRAAAAEIARLLS